MALRTIVVLDAGSLSSLQGKYHESESDGVREKRAHNVGAKNKVTALRAVASNVSKRPHSLKL